ncbi:diguanylate cyclase (GGDEF)-like protein [Rhizobium skierniewicense]|uniref:Diguanylate cyclase (GGDEF)-like protein n=1 Tax=Rhizobium skierniewicense TaxID=984260 RepID=A0A7W6C4L0_9HYPH|nr:bifunctional diguanylate cyclase/phosphodiesterase [Rhizobium skierniewicense]MBB3945627.1 diguanylate cyclase (GGDEF)-like protein [Rhizobium skierniewicense]
MYQILSCLAVDHDIRFTMTAVTICVLGSLLTIRLFMRARQSAAIQRVNWLFLTGTIGGATIWTTHFVAMLGFQTSGTVGFLPGLTGLSLMIAIATTMGGFAVATYGGKTALVEAGGLIVGLGIACMHYTGMAAYMVQGAVVWDQVYVMWSMVLGAFFGMLATSRIVRPVSWLCKYGGMTSLVLAIGSTHFTGMAAISIVFDPSATIPFTVVPSSVMAAGAVMITFVLMAVAFSTYVIDSESSLQAVARYRHLSLHDALTGIPNRAAFNEHLHGLLTRSADPTARIALLSFDLNRFKEINDVHGHSAGDAVLRALADRMTSVLLPGEFVARVGGDEFVAVLHRYYSKSTVLEFAKRLLGEMVKPVEWGETVLSVGASIGIAVGGSGINNADALISQADVAMYRAKSDVSGTIYFYDKSMDDASRARNALAISMRSGLTRGEFELYFQQQNDTTTGKVVGFEALLRWNHPLRGLISPAEFIPIAEQTGFIIEMGEWVLREACFQAVTWRNPLDIAINVAPSQLLDSDFVQKVKRSLQDSGLEPRRLELEITESGILVDHRRALMTIRSLKDLGVRIAMDDYGTGYSSLSTLQSFPFDKIKIDRGFVEGLATNLQSQAIVRSTLILANSLNIPVLAEGVETMEHMEFLRREGCKHVQGFYFGRPGPAATIDDIVNIEPEENVELDHEALPLAS